MDILFFTKSGHLILKSIRGTRHGYTVANTQKGMTLFDKTPVEPTVVSNTSDLQRDGLL